MNVINKRTLLFFLLALFAGKTQVFAEDVSIYTSNAQASTTRTNVLFLLDLSSSMKKNVDVWEHPFDPTIDYECKGIICFSDNKLYQVSGTFNGDASAILTNAQGFPVHYNHCQAMTEVIDTQGYYTDQFTQRQSIGYWGREILPWAAYGYVECRGDHGKHGQMGTTDRKFPGKNDVWGTTWGGAFWSRTQIWTNDEHKSFDWNNTYAQAYTIFTANYLHWFKYNKGRRISSETKTRLKVLKEETNKLLDTTSGINMGMMMTNRLANGAHVLQAVDDIDCNYVTATPDCSKKEAFKSKVEAIHHKLPETGSPLSESFWEAYLYYNGLEWDFGRGHKECNLDDGCGTWDDIGALVEQSVPESRTGSIYKSPIVEACAKNNIIVFSDGDPSFDTQRDWHINRLIRQSGLTLPSNMPDTCGIGKNNCAPYVSYYLNNMDNSRTLPDKQPVTTYSIGGFRTTGAAFLRQVAEAGGGKYFQADDADALRRAYNAIIIDILSSSTSFTAPAVSVNVFNNMQHRDELYFGMFKPSATDRWYGNIKRYGLKDGVIVDKNNKEAVDPNKGTFKRSSHSFWTPDGDPDGNQVELGGAGVHMTNNRTLYSFLEDYKDISAGGSDLTNIDRQAPTKAQLGIENKDSAYQSKLIQWLKGVDVFDENGNNGFDDARRRMADSIHNRPVVVTYGGTNEQPISTLFSGANDGSLHAIDTATGQELFSFVPKEFLSNQSLYFADKGDGAKLYGLDGSISTWIKPNSSGHQYQEDDGTLALATGARIYLYITLRRGGNKVYALDITDRTSPKLKWVISGDQPDFDRLAQTWSPLKFAKIKINNAPKHVMIFGGGNDPLQNDTPSSDDDYDPKGNAIYMVDAETGERIWYASSSSAADLTLTDMTYGITGAVAAIDGNSDGYVETLFASDTGGQVWRIDFTAGKDVAVSSAEFSSGGRIAKIASTSTPSSDDAGSTPTSGENTRRFYYGPDVSIARGRSGTTYYAVAMGTGHRPDPLETTVQNRFYMIKSTPVGRAPSSYSTALESNLFNATSNTASNSDKGVPNNNHKGWFITLDEGEKVLARSLTINRTILFTTFKPTGSAVSTCGNDIGTGKLYQVKISDSPIFTSQILDRPGIAPTPVAVIGDDGVSIFVGTEKINEEEVAGCTGDSCSTSEKKIHLIQRSYWMEKRGQ